MANNWLNTTLSEAFFVNPLRSIRKGQVTPFIPMDVLPENGRSPKQIEEREFTGSGMKFQNGDTLIARITPCLENGKTAFINALPNNTIAHGSTEYIVLSGKPNYSDNLYGYYLVRSPEFRSYAISHMEGTSGRQRVPSSAVERYAFLLPTIKEQRAIAHVLGTLDDKIELNCKQNETLEAMASTLFKAWFVDFEPVRTKMEGRWQRGQSLPGLPAHLYDLFPDRLVDSELGEIPEGWEITDFGAVSLCFDKYRIPLSSKQRENRKGLIPYHGATSVMDFVDEYIFDGIYLLLGEDGSVLKEDGTPFIQYIWGKSWVNNHAHVLQGTNGLSTEHLMLFIASQNITAYVTGAVQLKLNQKNMNSIPLVKAPNEINLDFTKLIAPLFDQYRQLSEQSIALAQLRDTLLPKLISGELRVPDAERIIENLA